jgi:hypothetical protein
VLLALAFDMDRRLEMFGFGRVGVPQSATGKASVLKLAALPHDPETPLLPSKLGVARGTLASDAAALPGGTGRRKTLAGA